MARYGDILAEINKGNRIERRINGEIYRKRKKVKLDYNEYRRTLVHELALLSLALFTTRRKV